MAFINGPWIELNENEITAFREQMRNPDREAMRRRDAFLDEIRRNPWQAHDDGSYEIEFDIETFEKESSSYSPIHDLYFANTYLPGESAVITSEMDNTTELMAA